MTHEKNLNSLERIQNVGLHITCCNNGNYLLYRTSLCMLIRYDYNNNDDVTQENKLRTYILFILLIQDII